METKANILVVDDNEALCEGMKDYLVYEGYTVECANNGKDAIALVQGNTYDVTFVDIRLPDIQGTELVKKLVDISPSTEFIHMTAHASLDTAIKAVKQENVASYETKPLDMDHLLSILKQIMKRKKMEEMLRESDEKSLLLLNSTGEAIYGLDLEGNCTFCNPSCLSMLGYEDESQLLGRNMHGLIHHTRKDGTPYPEEECCIYQAFREGKGAHVDDEVLWRADGTSFAAEYRSFPTIRKGKTIGSVVSFVDITERKKLETALLQSEKLRSIGTITAGISHEFNNILAIISGNVQLLKETYKDHGGLTETLRIIKTAVDDGAEISRNMLKFTRSRKNSAGFVSSDIRDLIRQSIDFTMPRWKNEAQAKGINYKIDTEGMKSVSPIMCNPTELREVFINIISNALDAMPEGGSLSFSTWSGDDTVFAGISDTGEGMSDEVRKNIFDPFFTTKTPVGTGLGMSMTYGIITRHGGKIEVESELGKGSKFALQFPTTTKAVSPIATPEPNQETNEKNLRILVVDDEVAICDILDKFLSGSGHKVKTVDNGADAINLIKTEYFDLVLCDLSMTDICGLEVIKFLNELERIPKIGIITGWGEKLKPIEEGMNVDFVARKPFDFSELANHINEAFGTDSR